MHGRAELHFHLLPDLDDGPAGVAEAVALAQAAAAEGTQTIVCTPHARFLSGARDLADRVAALRRELGHAGVAMDLRPGAELLPADVARLHDDTLDAYSQGPPTAPWLLLEAPLEPGGLDGLHAAVDALADRGFGVLLAHPERCPELLARGSHGRPVDTLCAQGVRLQVNATSLTGLHGPQAQAAALALVRRGVATVLASDAHGRDRPPSLVAALAVLREAGVEGAERLAGPAPRALLRRGLAAPVVLARSA
ncbi:hypothetical protein FSW04_05795 [Baekduia soli]|uniref:protein-tyrosine-phosphatase n=1 Tax=Baekduia soli TaxID=496014 RepID=A0A5B8U254_9ACTN|nr:CpsB/CapC family capsule biosynthesis tyrosine phosphatase [Baekduia soli]QEC47149.1 hypothetical protein FSW04_05795 [Baekduia soli]